MKKLLFAALHCLRITRFAAWWNRRRVVFLCYHGVTRSPAPRPSDPHGLHVYHERFARQLAFLRRNYNLISLDNYLAAAGEGRQLPDYSLVVTFDDGFRNFLTVAAPMLAERNIPATVFVITDYAAGEPSGLRAAEWTPTDDQRYVSWDEIRQLKEKYGFGFGSHTCSHSRLLTLTPLEAERELAHSFSDLRTQLNLTQPSLSYPKGEYSEMLAADARKLGYACAVTTDRGINELSHDRFTLGRSLIGDHDDEASFAVRVSGLRWWLARAASAFGWRRTAAHPLPAQRPAPAHGLRLQD